MRSKPIYRYIGFGVLLRQLRLAEKGWHVHGKNGILESIDIFFKCLEEFELLVTQRAVDELREFRDELAKSDSKHVLTDDGASRLRDIMEELDIVLRAETQGKIAFIVTDKRVDVNKLVSNVPGLMAPGIFDSLADIAQYDFIEAGKCIAFELPTAAAFHLMRGTESVLRCFYRSVIKRDRVNPLLWGPMVHSLRKSKKPPPAALLDNLDNIRRSFRNPTQHPDKIYDIEEVQDLFGLCIDAVDRMVGLS